MSCSVCVCIFFPFILDIRFVGRTSGSGREEHRGTAGHQGQNGNLLRDKGDILRRWERFFGNLLNTKSPALQPSIIEKVQERRKAPPPPPPRARSQIEEPISLEGRANVRGDAGGSPGDGKLESAGR